MAHRRESEQRVELFPFLAVLVCAMGALILLLLVMTRRIRQQAELRAEHERQAAIVAAAPPPAPPVLAVAPPTPPRPAPRRTPPPRPVIIRRAPPVPEPPPVYVDPTYDQRLAARQAEFDRAAAELERDWQQRVQSLTADRQRLETELQSLQATLQERKSQVQTLESQTAAASSAPKWDATVDARLQADLAELERRSAAVRQEIDVVSRQLHQTQAQRAAQAKNQFTIIPFDARTGTTRRPIVLVCERDRITFACEGISLSAAELDDFIPHYNPLSAGVRTLVDGWSARDHGAEPYVLLVVRPEGTVGFYAARVFLQPLNLPFGYELVGADQQFTWPQTDARLVSECRRAIDEVLRDRGRVGQLAHVSGNREEPLRVLGQAGEFRLDEVDRMRTPGRSVQFGATRIDRDQFTAGNGGFAAGGAGGAGGDRRGLGVFRRPMDGSGDNQPPASGGADSQSPPGTESARGIEPSRGAEASGDAEASRDSGAAGSAAPLFGSPAAGASAPGRNSGGWTRSPGFGHGNKVHDPYAWRPPEAAGISVQRDVPVEITAHALRVAGGEPISISPDTDAETLGRFVAQGLEDQLAEWGEAPRGFYWNPRLKLIVTPDGAVLSGRLKPILETWGLDSTLDYASKFSRPPASTATR